MRIFLLLALSFMSLMATAINIPPATVPRPSPAQAEELDSLRSEKISRKNDLQTLMDWQDRWKNLYLYFGVATIICGVFTAIFQVLESSNSYRQRPLANRISFIDARIAAINDEVSNSAIADASKEAADANAKAKELEQNNLQLQGKIAEESGKVAGLQKSAADARAVQQRVETELAKQQERAANAERSLLELEERIKPRILTGDQRTILVDRLKQFDHGKVIISAELRAGGEGMEYADRLRDLFKYGAGWEIEYPNSQVEILNSTDVTAVGLIFFGRNGTNDESITPTLKAIGDAFTAAGVVFHPYMWTDPRTEDDLHHVRVVVGMKPLPIPKNP
jgi:hypothetical protein